MTKKAMLCFWVTVIGIALALFGAGYKQFLLMGIGIPMFLSGLTGIMLIKDLLKD